MKAQDLVFLLSLFPLHGSQHLKLSPLSPELSNSSWSILCLMAQKNFPEGHAGNDTAVERPSGTQPAVCHRPSLEHRI